MRNVPYSNEIKANERHNSVERILNQLIIFFEPKIEKVTNIREQKKKSRCDFLSDDVEHHFRQFIMTKH